MNGLTPKRVRQLIAVIAVCLILISILLLSYRLITGSHLIVGFQHIKHLGRAILNSSMVEETTRGDYTNVIFLHHSTGNNLIVEGEVRERFAEASYDFWDHHYNTTGLRDPEGQLTGYSYRVPKNNTDPDGLAAIFAQRVYQLPLNTLSGLLQHEVIVFKSCFPASHIASDEQFQRYKDWYLGMRAVMDQHPDHVFVVMSPPPLNPVATTPEAAARARSFADWLTSDAYLDGHTNVYAFDFFDQLAEGDPTAVDYNMLRSTYREGEDSHPNQKANEVVGPTFAAFVMNAAQDYREHVEQER